MTKEEAVKEIEKAFEPAFANYIITALTEGATVSDFQRRYGRAYEAGVKDGLEQKPCEDAVSRKSVIAIIQNHWWNCRDIDKLVNDLPSVTPQEPKWIPVTERLPEEGQFVIVSYPYDASDYSRKRVMTAWYHKEYGFTCGIADAWLPLPEPYKGGKGRWE